jgi:hypothetical protein
MHRSRPSPVIACQSKFNAMALDNFLLPDGRPITLPKERPRRPRQSLANLLGLVRNQREYERFTGLNSAFYRFKRKA